MGTNSVCSQFGAKTIFEDNSERGLLLAAPLILYFHQNHHLLHVVAGPGHDPAEEPGLGPGLGAGEGEGAEQRAGEPRGGGLQQGRQVRVLGDHVHQRVEQEPQQKPRHHRQQRLEHFEASFVQYSPNGIEKTILLLLKSITNLSGLFFYLHLFTSFTNQEISLPTLHIYLS